jgi:hypothetical protein
MSPRLPAQELTAMSTNHNHVRSLVDRHFAEGLSLADEARLREHLPGCTACRQAYESYQVAERLDPRAAGPRERLATALGLPQSKWRRRWGLRCAIVALPAVAAVALLAVVSPPRQTGNGFSSRGKEIEPVKAPDVAVFRMKGKREAIRVQETIASADELAFAYRNELGKSFLMIFGVDGAGQVLWYHPAWTDPADNPKAVPITRQIGFKELPDAVRHALRGPTLTVHALFMDKALDVRTVEARLAKGGFAADMAAGELLRKTVFEVRP